MSRVDVVIVTYNSKDEIAACVEPLRDARDARVIVVDNASQDGTRDVLADLPVDIVALDANHGFGYGCNVGWRRGASPYVLFLNPDARVTREALERMVAIADGDPEIGAVAPRIAEPDGALDWSLRRFPRLRSTYAQALFLHRVFPHSDWTDGLVRDRAVYEYATDAEWVSGACILVKRTVCEQIDGFDDGFFLYCEDIDLCRRISDAGYRIRFDPTATVVHEGGHSAPRAALLPVLAASRVRYARKHQTAPVATLERIGIALGSVTHAIVARGGLRTRRGHLRALVRALS